MQDIYLGPGDSLDEQISQIREAFNSAFNPPTTRPAEVEGPWVREVYADYIIIQQGDRYFRVPYTRNEAGEPQFAAQADWQEVRQAWEPVPSTQPEAKPALEDIPPAQDYRFFTELQFEDDFSLPEQIPIHCLVDRQHPVFGRILMTEEMMDQAIANFRGRVHRPRSPLDAQIPVDERHEGGPACGWVVDMYKKLPYLLAKVAWTRYGREVVADKRYRYVSPVYELGDRGPVFKEVTLTNRDFLHMPPIDTPIVLDEGCQFSPIVPPNTDPIQRRNIEMTDPIKSPTEGHPENVASAPAPVVTLAPDEWQAMQSKLKALEDKVARQDAELREKELEAQRAEVENACQEAIRRGVSAFTVDRMRVILLQLPRKQEGVEISLEAEGHQKKYLSVYAYLLEYLAQVPDVVPQGERTLSAHTPPAANATEKITPEEIEVFIRSGGGRVKEE